jgi:hypothetical protein
MGLSAALLFLLLPLGLTTEVMGQEGELSSGPGHSIALPRQEKSYLSRDPQVMRAGLENSVRQFQRAAAILAAAPSIEDVRTSGELIYRGYVMVRAVHSGLQGRIQQAKVPDRREEWVYQKIQTARSNILQAHRRTQSVKPTPADIETAAEDLNAAIRIIRQARDSIY